MLENKYTVLLNFSSKFCTSVVSQQWEWSLLKIQTGTLFSTIQLLTAHKFFSYQIFNLFKKFYLQIRLRRSCFKYHCCCGEQQNLRESLKMLYSKKRIFTFVLTSWSAKLPYIEQSRDYRQHSTKYGENLKKYCEFAFSS